MTNTLPLSAYGFLLLAVILLAMTWRTLRSMWANHGSADKLAKRQLEQARKDELMYAQAAEYYAALATGARTTINRLSGPSYTPGAGTTSVTIVSKGGGAGGSGFKPPPFAGAGGIDGLLQRDPINHPEE